MDEAVNNKIDRIDRLEGKLSKLKFLGYEILYHNNFGIVYKDSSDTKRLLLYTDDNRVQDISGKSFHLIRANSDFIITIQEYPKQIRYYFANIYIQSGKDIAHQLSTGPILIINDFEISKNDSKDKIEMQETRVLLIRAGSRDYLINNMGQALSIRLSAMLWDKVGFEHTEDSNSMTLYYYDYSLTQGTQKKALFNVADTLDKVIIQTFGIGNMEFIRFYSDGTWRGIEQASISRN